MTLPDPPIPDAADTSAPPRVAYYPVPAPAAPPFLDVPTLLEASQPARIPRLWFLLGGFLLVVVAGTVFSTHSPELRGLAEGVSALVMVGLMVGLSGATVYVVRKFRREQQAVDSVGEMIQLRRWPEAALQLQQFLSRPARTGQLRAQALVYLSSVLSRYHRFPDAIAVQEHLLDNELVDPGTAYGLRLGRAMAMLREDHLFDADRAISELRRAVPDGLDSAGLALVEIYRDVKTGHPEEAIALFEKKLPALRDQLGHRVADAWALVARAYDLRDRRAEAKIAFENATLLAPPAELFRRYPEVEKLRDKYAPAFAPAEAA